MPRESGARAGFPHVRSRAYDQHRLDPVRAFSVSALSVLPCSPRSAARRPRPTARAIRTRSAPAACMTIDPARTSAHRHDPVSRHAAARGQGGRADLRRRPAAALHQPRARRAGRAMREGQLFHHRPHGARLSGPAAPHPRRRPHHRHPQREPSAGVRPDAARRRAARDRARLCVDAQRRCAMPNARRAVLPHSGPAARRRGRELSALARA